MRLLLASALLASGMVPGAAAAAPPSTYAVGSIPVAVGQGDLEFPVSGDFRGQVGTVLVSQGTFDNRNPFSNLSGVGPWAWLHYDGFPNLRLSVGFEEVFFMSIPDMGIASSHEERGLLRARLQQPRGASALYQMLQLDIRSFNDPSGQHQIVWRPRLRLGVGFNLDATRIHSTTLYMESALRFADSSYTTHAFDFYRAVLGYTWTTRRGLFATAAIVGQVSLNPPGSGFTVLFGPVLSLAYRIAPPGKAAEEPPQPPEIEPQ